MNNKTNDFDIEAHENPDAQNNEAAQFSSRRRGVQGMIDDIDIVCRINVAAQRLGVSRATVYRLIHAGKLELVKISCRASGVTRRSMLALIKRSTTDPERGRNTTM